MKVSIGDTGRFITHCIIRGFCLSLAFVVGCGGPAGPTRVAAEGNVTLDGKNLAAGIVRFIPVDTKAGPAAVATVKDGVFKLTSTEGPVLGSHRIEIEATYYFEFAIDDEKAYAEAHKNTGGNPIPPNPVPPIYNKQSTLTAEVKEGGENKFDFKLQGTAKQ